MLDSARIPPGCVGPKYRTSQKGRLDFLTIGWCEGDREPFAATNADPRLMGFLPKVLNRPESDALAAAARGAPVGFEELALPEIVSFTVPENRRSRAVMERLGMTRDPADDLLRPALPEGHPSGPHVRNRVRTSE